MYLVNLLLESVKFSLLFLFVILGIEYERKSNITYFLSYVVQIELVSNIKQIYFYLFYASCSPRLHLRRFRLSLSRGDYELFRDKK